MSTWIQVVGVFDKASKTGEILGVQPAVKPMPTQDDANELALVALDAVGTALAEVAVVPEYGSCGDEAEIGSFQTYLDLPDATRALSLRHEGAEIAQFVPDSPKVSVDAESFGLAPLSGHTVGLTHNAAEPSNATYTLQAREKGAAIWETLDIGLERPDAAKVDVNQFPGAKVIEVRVLKSSGFSNVAIDQKEIDFSQ